LRSCENFPFAAIKEFEIRKVKSIEDSNFCGKLFLSKIKTLEGEFRTKIAHNKRGCY